MSHYLHQGPGTSAPVRFGRAPGLASAGLVVAAVLLGIYADVGQRLDGVLGTVPELGTPWLLVAFTAGGVWRHQPWAAVLAGPSLVSSGLIAYWSFMKLAHGTSIYNMTNDGRGAFWLGAAAILGTAAGLAGLLAGAPRPATRSVGWSAIVAVPLAESARVVAFDLGTAPGVLGCGLVIVAIVLLAASARRCPWRLTGVMALGWAAAGAAVATQVLPRLV